MIVNAGLIDRYVRWSWESDAIACPLLYNLAARQKLEGTHVPVFSVLASSRVSYVHTNGHDITLSNTVSAPPLQL
jgi:hypothetical protein